MKRCDECGNRKPSSAFPTPHATICNRCKRKTSGTPKATPWKDDVTEVFR